MRTLNPGAVPRPTTVAARWVTRRTIAANEIPSLEFLHARKRASGFRTSVGIPAFNDETTIRAICRSINDELMSDVPLVDELIVLDSGSVDESVVRARDVGAPVVSVQELMPEVPPSPGKGDSLWRSLTVLSGDLVAWIDGDVTNFQPHMVTRLFAPFLLDPTIGFVKGYHERADEIELEIDGVLHMAGGERVTDLLARPLLNIFFPELGGFFQPLAGSYAGRMDVLRRIPFLSGCSVDVAILIDLLDEIGLDGMAQAELGPSLAGDRSLDELSPKAHAIARTILRRAEERKRIKLAAMASMHPLLVRNGKSVEPIRIDEVERPPIEVVPPYLAALRESGALGNPSKAHIRALKSYPKVSSGSSCPAQRPSVHRAQ